MGTVKKRKARGADGRRTNEDFRDANGDARWDAQVYVGRKAGRPQFVMQSFKTKKAADAWVREQESHKDQNLTPTTTRVTLGEYLARWLPVDAASVKDTTAYTKSKALHKWIIDPKDKDPDLMIGLRRLDKLTADHFERFYVALRRYLKPRGVEHLHGIMRKAMKAAVRKHILPRNPMEGVTLPKDNAKGELDVETDIRYLTLEEAKAFQAAARKDRLSALWHLLLTTGMRPGEAFALRWADIDLDEGLVNVRATLSRLALDKASWEHATKKKGASIKTGGWKVTKPKTKNAFRVVRPTPAAVEELRIWRVAQKRERMKAGEHWRDHGFVFTTELGTPVNGSNTATRAFRRVMEGAGLGQYVEPETKNGPAKKRRFVPSHRLYDLRHTYATLSLEQGVPLEVISTNMGHASIKITADVYAKVTPKRRDQSAELLARALTG